MQLREMVAKYAEEMQIVPPVAMHTLRTLVDGFVTKNNIDQSYGDWLMVEMHNAIWMPIIAKIPFDRRLLLVPKCLSNSQKCEGEIDELGLLCHRCGRCVIPSLEDRAAELGVLSMVAEGFTSVIDLIENHVVDTVIGVSCLDSLEKAFPLLVSHAVPGLAVALNYDGCKDTEVDAQYVMQIISKRADDDIELMDYNQTREQVNEMFADKSLRELWNPGDDKTNQIAFGCLADGKRWRPFILAAVYQALSGDKSLPNDVQRAALAIECFHKASLVHDDIQDKDNMRYDKPTVNALYGDEIAINIGDLLLGQGYRMLASCENKELLSVIADAHVRLCKGQGMELMCKGDYPDDPLNFVLEIHANKTAPAFEAALVLGFLCAGKAAAATRDVLVAYSRNLGIAYQLNDDIEDFEQDKCNENVPSAIAAIQKMHADWGKDQVLNEVKSLAREYHEKALDVISDITNLEAKRLLFQITEKVLK